MARLTKEEFLKTFQQPMQDIWPYVDAISSGDLIGNQLLNECVEYVYRDASGRFDQVLIPTDAIDVFLVIVVDLEKASIHGHHLLHLPELYEGS